MSCQAALFVATTLSGANARAQAQVSGAPQSSAASANEVLLLQDGGILVGQIKRNGNWYIVACGGGQMQVTSDRVTHVCRTTVEAYEYQRQQSSASSAAAHLVLADWCMRYNLLDEAGRELGEARNLDPDHPRLSLLELRLEKARESPTTTKPTQIPSKVAKTPPVKEKTPAQSSVPKHAALPTDLPDGAVELFARKVQPILVNSCTTSGCHQPGGRQSFQLDRSVLRGENSRRSTIHNLEAAIALIDREHPEKSRLLTIPHERHGGMSAPIFGPRLEPAYKNLAAWVMLVTTPPNNEASAHDDVNAAATNGASSVATPATAPQPAVANNSNVEPVPDDRSATTTSNRTSPRATETNSPIRPAAATEESTTLIQPHALKVGVRLQAWQPRDVFDPEIFNRMQQARANAANPVVSSTTDTTR
jgi:hypothetical protein